MVVGCSVVAWINCKVVGHEGWIQAAAHCNFLSESAEIHNIPAFKAAKLKEFEQAGGGGGGVQRYAQIKYLHQLQL